MTVDERLDGLRDLVQRDVGHRGLARDPSDNLFTHGRGDLAAACRGIAGTPKASMVIVTGFYIPAAGCGETDGPLGAVFLARALVPLGVRVAIVTDAYSKGGLAAGLEARGLGQSVPLEAIPPDWRAFQEHNAPTHLIALERVGPSHTAESIRGQPGAEEFMGTVPPEHRDRCHTMRGQDVTAHTPPAHRLFEAARERQPLLTTIGIGDGGNEIGMGKVAWDTIRRNIPNGGLIACRVPADHLIVAGVSNWGAYALAAGVLLLRREKGDAPLFDPERERELLRVMVERGPLVDGVTGQTTATVDGLTWEQYAAPLAAMGRLVC